MRKSVKHTPTRGISSMKKILIALGIVCCIVLYIELRARFIYQWQIGEVGEDEEEDVDATPPEEVDVYAFFREPNLPLVASRYRVQEPLGKGFVSRAYAGLDIVTQEEVVLKFTYINVTENTSPTPLKGIPDNVLQLKALQQEYATYRALKNSRLLQAYYYGDYQGFKVLVTQRGGQSLFQHQENIRIWSKNDVFQIARNIIYDLEQLHDKSYIHNDMHTGNIAFKVNDSSYQVNLIDFNSCKRYRSMKTLQHYDEKNNYFRVMIHRFSPPCYYKKKICSRRDDLASLGYMVIMLASEYANCSPIYTFSCPETRTDGYWFGPALPWVKVTGRQNMIDFMTNISFNILNSPNNYRHQLPDNFRLYFEHLETLQFTSRPDYSYLASLFL